MTIKRGGIKSALFRVITAILAPIRFASLRPYGDSLLTPGAAFWINAAMTMIVIMAAAEGLSWGYAAHFLAGGDNRNAVGVGAFTVIFCLVFYIDATLMSIDRWKGRNDKRIVPDAEDPKQYANLLAVASRIALISGSMYLTAPFLAQMMFKSDIDRALQQKHDAVRHAQRSELVVALQARAKTLSAKLDDLRDALNLEVAGAGITGQRGHGEAADQLAASIRAFEEERRRIEEAIQTELSEFDRLSDDEVARRYAIKFPGDSFQDRGAILNEITNKNYDLIQLAVRGFLLFIFTAMLILKFFESASVSVYYSERLQDIYRQYRRGQFDHYLAGRERIDSNGDMSALRFEDWALHTYSVIRDTDIESMRSGERIAHFRKRADEMSQLICEMRASERMYREEEQQLDSEFARLTMEQAHIRQEVRDHEARIAWLGEELSGVAEVLAQSLSSRGLLPAMTVQARLAAELDQRRQDLGPLLSRDANATRELEDLRPRLAQCQELVASVSKSRQNTEVKLQRIRELQSAEIEGEQETRRRRLSVEAFLRDSHENRRDNTDDHPIM